MNVFFKSKPLTSSKFSDFIRKSSSAEKKRVYAAVILEATERQRTVLGARGVAIQLDKVRV